ncbi:hypothetical protein HY490_01445 [Candidatus Woesearchaeota archaeon]|nr:hypothetical protein [Candidatus Woesearchaeota archaeon]
MTNMKEVYRPQVVYGAAEQQQPPKYGPQQQPQPAGTQPQPVGTQPADQAVEDHADASDGIDDVLDELEEDGIEYAELLEKNRQSGGQ